MDQGEEPNTDALDTASQKAHMERPYKCLECHNTYRRVEHLTRHTRSHRTEHHLECRYCYKGFYRLDALKRHENVHSKPHVRLLGKGPRACLACAASRRRCSGDTSCSACEKRSVKCEYPAACKTRRGSLGSTPKEALDAFSAKCVIISPRETSLSWSNSSQPPVAASQASDPTYPPVDSDYAGVVQRTMRRQNRSGKTHKNNQATSVHVIDDQSFEEQETASCHSFESQEFQNTRPPEDEDAIDVARSPSANTNAHKGTLTSSRVNAAMNGCPTIPPYVLKFRVPAFIEFSEKRNRRALVDHFCNVFCHLIIFCEDLGNPFRLLILPLAHRGSPVMNAIYALSCAHLENLGVETGEKSIYFHNEATRGLARLIDNNARSNKEDILGAILLLVYYESLVQRDSSNMVICHLKGAMSVIKSYSQSSSPTSMFLHRVFRYYDVITALSFGTAPILSLSTPLLPLHILGATSPSSHNDVDSLLGMATNFWHIIHRLSLLCELKGEIQKAEDCNDTIKVSVLRTELEDTSHAIEHILIQWKPSIQWPPQTLKSSSAKTPDYPDPTTASSSQLLHLPSLGLPDYDYDILSPPNVTNNSPSDADAHIQSIANNAEAYRQAALVFLYRNIHMLERSHPKVQKHSHLALAACIRVVGWAGPMPALLWPLFIGSVEVISERGRYLAMMAFSGAERRQAMINITKAREIVEEVWRRGTEGDEVDWRSICEERGVSLVFG